MLTQSTNAPTLVWLPGAMVARLASMPPYQKAAGSSPAVVTHVKDLLLARP